MSVTLEWGMVCDRGQGLLMVDREMGARIFKIPPDPMMTVAPE